MKTFFSLKRIVFLLTVFLLICAILVSCAPTPEPESKPEVQAETLKEIDPAPKTDKMPRPEDPDKPEIRYSFSSGCWAGWSRYPRYMCATIDYMIVSRVTGYLGGLDLAQNNHHTLLEVENLENMMGDLVLGRLPVSKHGGIDWKNYYCSTTSGDYFPEVGSLWILLLKARENGALQIDGIVGHGMFLLEIEDTDDTAVLLERIHNTEVYQEYLAGALDHELSPEVNPDTITHYPSPFENGSDNAQDRDKYFIPDWTYDNLYELLPHKQESPVPVQAAPDEGEHGISYPDGTIVRIK